MDHVVAERKGLDEVNLLVLDFAGVCTPTPAELATQPAGELYSPIPIRPACERIVERAQSEGVVVAVLSNEIDRAWASSVPLLARVDYIFACTDNGILKPDRRAYERVLLVTGVDPSVALYVDDEPDNLLGAQAAGLGTVLFDAEDPEQSWAEIAAHLGVDER